MRTLLRLLVLGALLASAGGAFAQTVTPVASQLLPCRAGAGDFNTCGGLCAVGYHCVYVPANGDCSCQADGLVCGVGTMAEQGYCPGLPSSFDGNCKQRGGGTTAYRCR